jgi:hypothetical protein
MTDKEWSAMVWHATKDANVLMAHLKANPADLDKIKTQAARLADEDRKSGGYVFKRCYISKKTHDTLTNVLRQVQAHE